ncbi:MAG: RNA 2',3'-cyclic phosphodiesterase [Solirubrobacterales bacterium]|nr:MAG: RNA 2',3'-cyclic phosphodiesterase [Solirubrobacterales bacterium]
MSGASADRGRLFIALELPLELRRALSAWAAEPIARLGLRALATEQMHVTVAFLGAQPLSRAPALGDLVGEQARAVEDLLVGTALLLPRRSPRVLAVELEDRSGSFAGLHTGVIDALAGLGLGTAGPSRRVLPHVTVARGRPRSDLGVVVPRLGEPFAASALTLLRSHTLPDGARYEMLRRVRLAP